MAYLLKVPQECLTAGCTKRPVMKLYDRNNLPMGSYCDECAEPAREALDKQDRRR